MNERVDEYLGELATYMAGAVSPALRYATTPRQLFILGSDDTSADPNGFAVLMPYQGGEVPFIPAWRLPVQCMVRAKTNAAAIGLASTLITTLVDSNRQPLRMKTLVHYRINGILALQTPFPLPPDERERAVVAFNFDNEFVKVN